VLPPLSYSNKPQVLVEYHVSEVGISFISEVQVYLTRDDGQSWEKWAAAQAVGQPVEVDASKGTDTYKHTLQVDLPGEGIYGIYLVVMSGVGKCQPPPQNGVSLPMIRFEVDTQPPYARLFLPEVVLDSRDAVLLSWEALDRNLTDTPICLEWAEHPNGPWEGIGPPELPNTPSRYTWKVPPKTPPSVFLRVRVRDRAGNVNLAQSKDLIPIDLNTPKVQFVQPGQTKQNSGGPQVVPGSVQPVPIVPAEFHATPPQ
jgi:hypothetical protein